MKEKPEQSKRVGKSATWKAGAPTHTHFGSSDKCELLEKQIQVRLTHEALLSACRKTKEAEFQDPQL